MRVKICGITRLEDALAAAEAGADAVGFVFWPHSPRFVSLEEGGRMASRLPPFLQRVGVFVDSPPSEVRKAIEAVGLTTLQFHGKESPEYCSDWSLPVIKAFRTGPEFSLREVRPYRSVSAILVDGYRPGLMGGAGVRSDWTLAQRIKRYARVILAGGLTPENVGEAIRAVRPYAVDVSSGVEKRPGQKDWRLVFAFVRAVQRACQELEGE